MIIPKHIAFICNGNGRWANARGLDRSQGHIAGILNIPKVLEICIKYNVNIISCYIWSTENWGRSKSEVTNLMNAIKTYGPGLADTLHKRNVRLIHSGSSENIPIDVLKVINDAIEMTKSNTQGILNLLFNYGSRAEIVEAVKKICKDKIEPRDITLPFFEKYLYTYPLPKVDLLIRSGQEYRFSNFMLWQCAFAEIFVSNKYWPDIDKGDIYKAIFNYQESKVKS